MIMKISLISLISTSISSLKLLVFVLLLLERFREPLTGHEVWK